MLKKASFLDISCPFCYTDCMQKEMIERLAEISQEEREILAGQNSIDRSQYASGKEFIVSAQKLLKKSQFALRPHTRFIDFPEHGHDFMEFMYVIQGSITHRIEGEAVTLKSGEILFLNRHIRHSVLRAGTEDIGVNFIASNAFLQVVLHNVENNSVMSEFLARNFAADGEGEYLHFKTQSNYPIRNLLDNLIYAVAYPSPSEHLILKQLISLLFTYLAEYEDLLAGGKRAYSPDAQLRRTVVDYLSNNYPAATLGELAERSGYSAEYLSRRVHELFKKPFRELLADQRLKAAERMLRTTDLSVCEIIQTIGYENNSHFHRIFLQTFGMTPRKYRLYAKSQQSSEL